MNYVLNAVFAILLGKPSVVSEKCQILNKIFTNVYCESAATLVSAQDTCHFGNSNVSEVGEIREQRFYLDVNNPAPCTGNITSWRVCYYGPEEVVDDGSYWATYAIYRRIRSTAESADLFERVSEMFSAIRTAERFVRIPTVDGEIVEGGFNCYEDTRDAGDSQLMVQAGDILGACVFDPSETIGVTRRQLDIVGEASGESLLEMSSDGCSRDTLPMSIPMNALSTVESRRLHLNAQIGNCVHS